MAHRYPIKVRFYELDPYNHLNHASYVQYFEVGRVELLESIGFGLAFERFQVDLGADFSNLVDTVSLSGIYSF